MRADRQLAFLADVEQAGARRRRSCRRPRSAAARRCRACSRTTPQPLTLPSYSAVNTSRRRPVRQRDDQRRDAERDRDRHDVRARDAEQPTAPRAASRRRRRGRRRRRRARRGRRRRRRVALGRSLTPPALPSSGPSRSRSTSCARHLADDAAAVDHGDAVGQLEDLLELGGDEQHADAGVGRVPEPCRSCTRWRRRRGRASAGPRRARPDARESSRASTTRCWLPPESERNGASSEARGDLELAHERARAPACSRLRRRTARG